jgi:hypothetical protein
VSRPHISGSLPTMSLCCAAKIGSTNTRNERTAGHEFSDAR